ncbi:SO_0444 family Cu/Zn efflux transporter [Alishewanella sp. d11]|uniref:SO_0444 family Cu/Zn efflux transporter n=1 Tax=Alishewanella sp. d11 TaxID=3414030 RepID=UPI003BF88FA1
MLSFIENFWQLFVLSAPWLLVGLVVAAIMKTWIPMDWLQKQLGGDGVKPVVKGALFGAPLPLCSCGVIPAAMQLRRGGASKGATVAFLSATPETGVDSISVSYVLLGPLMAIVRPIAAISSAIIAGLLVGRTEHTVSNTRVASDTKAETAPTKSCCVSKAVVTTPVEPVAAACCPSKVPAETEVATTKTSCCPSKTSAAAANTKPSFLQQAKAGLAYSTGKLLSDFYLWLLIGLFFAALVQTLVPIDALAQYGSSIWMMLLMVLISVPMYVCATASTPIAAALMLMGISPGAALVFMQAGPATNIATISVVYKELGKRALGAYLFGVIVMSVFFGWLLDVALNYFDISVQGAMQHQHSVLPSWLELTAALLLAALILRIVAKQLLSPKQAS